MHPEITEQCCEIWPKIADSFRWFVFADWPDLRCMPCINVNGVDWRVNHCPSCGKEVRSVIMKAEK